MISERSSLDILSDHDRILFCAEAPPRGIVLSRNHFERTAEKGTLELESDMCVSKKMQGISGMALQSIIWCRSR